MISDVKTSYIFSFSDDTKETASYENGVLMHSTFYQKQTGSGVNNKSTTASGNFYKVTSNGESKMANFGPIHFGMLMLYTHVPDTLHKIYSGNFQQMLDINKVEENKYKLMLPDGKHNVYSYKNGICVKVEIVRALVSLQFVLKEIK